MNQNTIAVRCIQDINLEQCKLFKYYSYLKKVKFWKKLEMKVKHIPKNEWFQFEAFHKTRLVFKLFDA